MEGVQATITGAEKRRAGMHDRVLAFEVRMARAALGGTDGTQESTLEAYGLPDQDNGPAPSGPLQLSS
jgi:hypothetical protein